MLGLCGHFSIKGMRELEEQLDGKPSTPHRRIIIKPLFLNVVLLASAVMLTSLPTIMNTSQPDTGTGGYGPVGFGGSAGVGASTYTGGSTVERGGSSGSGGVAHTGGTTGTGGIRTVDGGH